jgi:hypothetical protein
LRYALILGAKPPKRLVLVVILLLAATATSAVFAWPGQEAAARDRALVELSRTARAQSIAAGDPAGSAEIVTTTARTASLRAFGSLIADDHPVYLVQIRGDFKVDVSGPRGQVPVRGRAILFTCPRDSDDLGGTVWGIKNKSVDLSQFGPVTRVKLGSTG